MNRDPQERVISIVYFSLIRVDKLSLKMVENYDAKWFAFNELPELILDHSQMVKDSISDLYPTIKNIIIKKSSLSMPTEFILDHNSISYLKSGKIDRNFYKKKYLND